MNCFDTVALWLGRASLGTIVVVLAAILFFWLVIKLDDLFDRTKR
jgi:hypothetical protein